MPHCIQYFIAACGPSVPIPIDGTCSWGHKWCLLQLTPSTLSGGTRSMIPSTTWAIWKWQRHLSLIWVDGSSQWHLENSQQSTCFGAMVSLFYLSCFCFFFCSSSCVDQSQPPVSNQNPFLITGKQQWILCQIQVLHGDYVILFACFQSACACNIIWFLVILIFAAFSNNLQQFIGLHVIPGLPAEFRD